MPDFELSYLADQDIVKIINYTVDRWGAKQATLYASLLDQHFKAIGNDLMLSKAVFDHRKDLCVSRCQKHMVFYWKRENQQPPILAVLHSRMDLMVHLEERLRALGI